MTAGAATNVPPSWVCQRGAPESAATARTLPVQSSKYAVPPATTGVPVTPTSPACDQLFCNRPTVVALTVCSLAFKRVFARSCPYTVHSSPLTEAAAEPRAVVVDNAGVERDPCDDEPELHAPASTTHATRTHVCDRRVASDNVRIGQPWHGYDPACARHG